MSEPSLQSPPKSCAATETAPSRSPPGPRLPPSARTRPEDSPRRCATNVCWETRRGRGPISTSRPNSTRPRPDTQGTSARGPEGAQTGTGAAASCVAAAATSRGSYWDRDPAREGTEQREYMKQEGGLDTCPASARGPRGRSSDAGQWQVVREAREQGLAGQTFLGHLQNFPFSLRWAQ